MATSIGLRSTGLTVFGARVVSAFTGLLFIVMAARWLAPFQLGIWEVIVTLVTFSSYPVGVVAYWATRDVARGRMLGKTALAVGTLMSGGGILLYYFFSFVTYSRVASSLLPFVLGSLLVPLSYWSAVANSIVQGYRPAVFGYSLVASEIAKILVAYEALYVYRLGIQGVILGLLASYLVQSVASTYLVRGSTREPLRLSEARRWAGLAWLPAVSYLPTVVGVADTYVASIGFGTAITGIYQAAFTVASVVGYSSALAFSLYPMLLRGGGERLPAITIDFSLLFSIPMAVGGVVLAEPILYLLGKSYLPGSSGLAILAVMFVFLTISGVVDQTLLGTERADVEEKTSFQSLVRSNLLFVPLVNIATAVVYVVGMFVALAYAFSRGLPSSESVALWASVQLVATVFFLWVKGVRASQSAKLMPGSNVAYYLVSAAAMGAIVYFLSGFLLDRSLDALIYGARLLAVIGAGTLVYFGIAFALDNKFRGLARSVLK